VRVGEATLALPAMADGDSSDLTFCKVYGATDRVACTQEVVYVLFLCALK
jgi:hypothetical protein